MASSLDRLEWTPENLRRVLEGSDGISLEQCKQRIVVILNNLGRADSGLVLDAGCGYGRLSAHILDRHAGTRIVGVDASQPMITAAKRELDPARFAPVLGRLESLPFRSGSFDVVFCIGVIMHVEDEIGAIHELTRLVRTNGRLLIDFHNRGNPLSVPLTVYRKIRGVRFRRVFRPLSFYRQALEDRGFKMRVIHPGVLFPGMALPIDLTPILGSLNRLFSNPQTRYGFEPLLEAWK